MRYLILLVGKIHLRHLGRYLPRYLTAEKIKPFSLYFREE